MASDKGSEPTQIELLVRAAQHGGQAEHEALVSAFLDAVVVVPSGSDPGAAAFEPVLIDIEGVSHMLVCDSLASAAEAAGIARYVASMTGKDVVRGVTPGHAILVRAGATGFAIDEALLTEIRTREV